jgi:hypothetical protein
VWSVAGFALYRLTNSRTKVGSAAVVAGAVFSHWVLDFLVHRPDLPLYDDSAKVGLGLWNVPAVAFGLEAALLFVGMWLYFKTAPPRRAATVAFGLVMLAIQAFVFFGPPPVSDYAAAATSIVAYAVFAAVIWFLERPASTRAAGAA